MIQEKMSYLILPAQREPATVQSISTPVINYSEILSRFGVEFRRAENYLEAGEIDWVQGWILDIGVICTQVEPLLESILPLLISENVPFRLVRNLEIANSVLGGKLSLAELGKIISIYPRSDSDALQLATQLISLTSSFKGPEILTDRQLSGVIFTRYGGCNPLIRLNHQNIEEKYIYDPAGNLTKEPLSIPFRLPWGIYWPFRAICPAEAAKKESVLQDKYKPMKVLKTDVKGSVRKGLMLQKLFKVSWCVIKEGRHCMNADDWGRDVHDRLDWQFALQKDLEGHIPVPKVYDFFQENGDSYLVMEFIWGIPLNDIVPGIIKGRSWPELPVGDRLLLLDYAMQILDIIETMHGKGYIHRDIQPNNFLGDKRQKLWLIDLELAYSERLQRPFPPFRLGTPGFMSPEQEAQQMPTRDQDIYAIGSMLTLLLTGLFPHGFSIANQRLLKDQLLYFVKDEIFVEIIVDCYSDDPRCRPNMAALKANLQAFHARQQELAKDSKGAVSNKVEDQLENIINNALCGLATPVFLNKDYLWSSKKVEEEALVYQQSKSLSVYNGYSSGLSGILYVLFKAQQIGFPIEPCMQAYKNSLDFLHGLAPQQMSSTSAGLYTGSAGIAITFLEALKAGLVPEKTSLNSEILLCLENKNLEGPGMANGLAGKGLALLHVINTIHDPSLMRWLQDTVEELLSQQQPDGSWISGRDPKGRLAKITGWAYGMAGIVGFLLEFVKRHRDKTAETAVTRALRWLIGQSRQKNRQVLWYVDDRNKVIDHGMLNGYPGIILCLIKAYEVLGDPLCKQTAEMALSTISAPGIVTDLTLASGLAGIGELYLEAAKIIGSGEWLSRAGSIVDFFLHYFAWQKDGSGYWLTKDNDFPTAELFAGNCGVIHFLLRYSARERLSHPFTIV